MLELATREPTERAALEAYLPNIREPPKPPPKPTTSADLTLAPSMPRPTTIDTHGWHPPSVADPPAQPDADGVSLEQANRRRGHTRCTR